MKRSRGSKLMAFAVALVLCLSAAYAPAFAASRTQEWSETLVNNARVAEELAIEGIILLENNGALPLQEKSVAMFGVGAARTYRGGSGSGDPWNGGLSGGGNPRKNNDPRYNVFIYDAFVRAGFNVTNAEYMQDLGARFDFQFGETMGGMDAFRYPEDELTAEQVNAAAVGADTAIFVIARNAGEGSDRSQNPQNRNGYLNGREPGTPQVTFEVGDYNLLPKEIANLRLVNESFENVIVVINCGGQIDTKFFHEIDGLDSLIFMGEAGQQGGAALAKLLTGERNFSGKTINTWAVDYADYPASATFGSNDNAGQDERYVEGIYVGYRYFDTAGVAPAYPFGYGLTYTDFEIEPLGVVADERKVSVSVMVKNVGDAAGKEVVQVYYSAPDGEGGERAYQTEKAYQDLIVYGKTDELSPGESQVMELSYNFADMAYYNEVDQGYALDPGAYVIRVGNSSRSTQVAAVLNLSQKAVTEKLANLMHTNWEILEEREPVWSKAEKGWTPYTYAGEAEQIAAAAVIDIDGSKIATETHEYSNLEEAVTTYTTDPAYVGQERGYQEMSRAPSATTLGFVGDQKTYEERVEVYPKEDIKLIDVYEGERTLEELVAQMSLYELATLNSGSGWGVWDENAPILTENYDSIPGSAAETTRELEEKYGIPFMVVNDGPGGLRVRQEFMALDMVAGSPTEGQMIEVYNYSTAWPVTIVRAATWNLELLEEFGVAYGKEMSDMGISVLLGTSLNIHRDPLCGRNFEYYSEDPVVSGYSVSAITLGLQSNPGVGACLKHYAANQQESRRNGGNSVMTERTARDIYLKGFEISVKSSQPMSIMTSYNLINDVPTADDYDLLENITRDEWGFEGSIMTDWGGGSSTPAKSMHGGNDFITPGGPSQVRNIMRFVEPQTPIFNDRGELETFINISASGITKAFELYSYTQRALDYDPENSILMRVPLGDGKVATLGAPSTVEGEDGYFEINVDGTPVIRTGRFNTFRGSKEDAMNGGVYLTQTTNLTTRYAEIEDEGKTLVYRFTPYNDNIDICMGDLQKSAINNLKVLMQSLGAKQYFEGVEAVSVVPWDSQFELKDYYGTAKSVMTAGVTAPETTAYGTDAEYVFAATGMSDVNLIDIVFTVDGGMLDIADARLEPLNGFVVFEDVVWTELGDGLWQCEAIVGAYEGVTMNGDMDFAKLALGGKDKKLGDAKLEIISVEAFGIDDIGGVTDSNARYCQIDPAAATTRIVSVYDLNGDDAVDYADLSLAFYYYQSKSGDANWDEAARADVNGSGAVDMVDLVAIYANFI